MNLNKFINYLIIWSFYYQNSFFSFYSISSFSGKEEIEESFKLSSS